MTFQTTAMLVCGCHSGNFNILLEICSAYDMQLIPIEKVFSNRDSIRKAREAFLILRTFARKFSSR